MAFTAGGCNSEGYPVDNTFHVEGKKAPSAPPLPSTFAYRYPDVAPVLNASGLQDFVGKLKQRVVVLEFWASWCRQNREELSTLAHLQGDLEEEGFQVIACNLDSPDKWASTTVPLLHGAGANYPAVVIRDDARAAVRAWLAPNWNYELPARFVIDRKGAVVATSLVGSPLSTFEGQVRQIVRGGGRGDRAAGITADAAHLRLKLINVQTGEAESLPELTSDPADAEKLGRLAAEQLARKIDRSGNPRIAVLPFPSSQSRRQAGPLGTETAKRLEESLKSQGYFDLVEPAKTQRLLDQAGVTAMAAEYDPPAVKGKLDADYLLIGWLRGTVDKSSAPAALAGGRSEAE